MANRFQSEFHEGFLNQRFVLDLACRRLRLTEEQIEKAVGRYIRGAHKGQLRGKLTWHKVTKGGWVKTGAYDWDTNHAQGYVVKPGITYAYKLWLGAAVLFEDGTDERLPRVAVEGPLEKPIMGPETPAAVRNLGAAEEARKVIAAGDIPDDLVAYLQKFIQDNS